MARRIERVCGPAAVGEAFVLKRVVPFRKDGVWGSRSDVLFPGYVLVRTLDPELLKQQLNLITEFHHLVCVGGSPASLSREEVDLLCALGGPERVVGTSLGEIVDGALRVTSGPLLGREALISKIDRHKRVAYLKAESFSWTGGTGSVRMPKVGLEVVSKR